MPCPLTLPPNLRRADEIIVAQAQALNRRLADMEREADGHRDDEAWQARWKSGVASLAALNDLRELLAQPIVRLIGHTQLRLRVERENAARAALN
jgi:hypothetical protein